MVIGHWSKNALFCCFVLTGTTLEMYTVNMVETKENTAFLHIRIKKELLDEAKKKAEKGDLNLSQVVRILISEWVNNPQEKLFF